MGTLYKEIVNYWKIIKDYIFINYYEIIPIIGEMKKN
jgi:hypothetical protein